MKTYISDIIPKIQNFSEKLDNVTLLKNQQWVSVDNLNSAKTVYIFRDNDELIISTAGKVKKGKWEYIDDKTLLITFPNESYLFNQGFFNKNILALKLDSYQEYAVFVNSTKYKGKLNSIEKVEDFLRNEYIDRVINQEEETNSEEEFYTDVIISFKMIGVVCFFMFIFYLLSKFI